MKAKLVDSMPSGDWIYEIKFDGYHALALRGGSEARVLSRNKKDLGRKFPEVTNLIAALNVHDAIIDGEIVALDSEGRSSFQLLQAFEMGEERLATARAVQPLKFDKYLVFPQRAGPSKRP
jgi:bifunctional non-homologous end joining protein LigD